jgi:hypothetical protein
MPVIVKCDYCGQETELHRLRAVDGSRQRVVAGFKLHAPPFGTMSLEEQLSKFTYSCTAIDLQIVACCEVHAQLRETEIAASVNQVLRATVPKALPLEHPPKPPLGPAPAFMAPPSSESFMPDSRTASTGETTDDLR